MNNVFIEAMEKRRTQYALGNELSLPQEEVTALIEEAVKLTPSAFNSQSSRVVILYHEAHHQFWQFVMDALKAIVPAERFAPTQDKINGFAAGAGTILFYEDQDTVKALQQEYPSYADNFPVWSEQSSGMAQFAVWCALANANIGASLQHYNPLPDAAIAKAWSIPDAWKLRAMMPFGSNKAPFPVKTFIGDAERFKVFN
ncbi:nitroreductase family protein [Neisseriaceae bacterium ESL0693]|nr:nitroreductase family protein [Neisseriaceae bacterium ESL0693]